MRTALTALILTAALAGCTGDTGSVGPQGPAGPTGPTGEQGPQGERSAPHIVTATVGSDGTATAALPGGTIETPPAITCYVREPGDPGWVVLATSRDSVCALIEVDGVLTAAVAGLPSGWDVLFVAVG